MIFNIASAILINAYVLICVDGSLCGDGVLLLQIGTTSSAQSQLLDVFDLTINQKYCICHSDQCLCIDLC